MPPERREQTVKKIIVGLTTITAALLGGLGSALMSNQSINSLKQIAEIAISRPTETTIGVSTALGIYGMVLALVGLVKEGEGQGTDPYNSDFTRPSHEEQF